MKSHKFTDYAYLEIKDLVDAGCLAIVPTGCTEQQGPHLPDVVVSEPKPSVVLTELNSSKPQER